MTTVVALVLACVFLVAAVAKSLDRAGTQRSLADFGVPRRLRAPLAVVLPLLELAVAIGLVVTQSTRVAAAVGGTMLAIFTGALAAALLRGRAPECGCFGRLQPGPAGSATLARNVALVAAAALVASQPSTRPTATELVAAVLTLVIGAQALLVRTLLRRYGRALSRIEELETRPARRTLEVGAEAPLFTLTESGGARSTLEGLLARAKPVLLVFSSSGCGPCQALRPKVAEWQERLTDELTVVLIEDEPVIAEWYGVEATPSAVLVGTDAKVAHALVAGARAIEELVGSLTPERERTPEPVTNGRVRVATGAALAGGLAVAAAAQAAPRSSSALDPELQAIDDVLRAAEPKLVSASKRSARAIRAQTTLKTGKAVRAKRTAARRALAAERRELLALRSRVDGLSETTVPAHNVKTMTHTSLTLLAQSLQKQERAIGASPKTALELVDESQKLLLRSLSSSAAAGKLLGRGG